MLLADHALSEQQHGNSDFCTEVSKASGDNSRVKSDGEEAKKDSHTCRMCNKTFSCEYTLVLIFQGSEVTKLGLLNMSFLYSISTSEYQIGSKLSKNGTGWLINIR